MTPLTERPFTKTGIIRSSEALTLPKRPASYVECSVVMVRLMSLLLNFYIYHLIVRSVAMFVSYADAVCDKFRYIALLTHYVVVVHLNMYKASFSLEELYSSLIPSGFTNK